MVHPWGYERQRPVIEFRHILCPTDFSDTSSQALAHAISITTSYKARLTVLHVVPTFDRLPESGTHFGGLGLGTHKPTRDEVLAVMRGWVGPAATALQPAFVADQGRAHEVIVNSVSTLPADLVVMGTHGRSGFSRLVFGSVTEKVLRTATCPVLTVPPPALAPPATPAFKKILCAVDFSPSALKALEYALELGRQADGCVTVLNAVEYMDEGEPWDDVAIRDARQHMLERARQRLHNQIARRPQVSCRIEEVVVANRAYRAILEHAAQSTPDLIVVGAQGRTGVGLMLYGSNAQHIVRAAGCPVFTVRA